MPVDPLYANGTAFVEGAYVPINEARIPLLDRGFIRSDATYDVFHVWKGWAFRLDDHMERFDRNIAALRMKSPYTRKEMVDILLECVSRSGLQDAFVQMTLTRGLPSKLAPRDPRLCENRFYAFAIPFIYIANEQQRAVGMNMHISKFRRIPPESLDPKIKNFHWLDLTQGLMDAFDRGADIEVLVDGEGHVTEGPGFNVFVVKNGRVATPASGVFDGMTRRTTLEICPELQMKCEERLVDIAEVRNADEVFITSTAGGIMPITKIDGQAVGDGKMGPATQRIHDEYWGRKAKGWLGTKVVYRD